MTAHPDMAQKKGVLHHEHRGATWHPVACETHAHQPCPAHDEENGLPPEELVAKGLHPSYGFQESCAACRKVKQAGYQPGCAACVETWAATREHMVTVQTHEEHAEMMAAARGGA